MLSDLTRTIGRHTCPIWKRRAVTGSRAVRKNRAFAFCALVAPVPASTDLATLLVSMYCRTCSRSFQRQPLVQRSALLQPDPLHPFPSQSRRDFAGLRVAPMLAAAAASERLRSCSCYYCCCCPLRLRLLLRLVPLLPDRPPLAPFRPPRSVPDCAFEPRLRFG